MRILIIILFICSCFIASAKSRLDSLFEKLTFSDYHTVRVAKDELVNIGKDAIPGLIEMMKNKSYLKLTNTMDLIYPGADNFYGHGYIVDYAIDWLNIRALWVFEEITDVDFNFKQGFKTGNYYDLLNSLYPEKVKFQAIADGLISSCLVYIKNHSDLPYYLAKKWWDLHKNNWKRKRKHKEH